jgi:hypothetical protein
VFSSYQTVEERRARRSGPTTHGHSVLMQTEFCQMACFTSSPERVWGQAPISWECIVSQGRGEIGACPRLRPRAGSSPSAKGRAVRILILPPPYCYNIILRYNRQSSPAHAGRREPLQSQGIAVPRKPAVPFLPLDAFQPANLEAHGQRSHRVAFFRAAGDRASESLASFME